MRSALSPTSLDSIARIGVVGGYAKAYNPSNGLELAVDFSGLRF